MALDIEKIAYFENETGRSLCNWVIRWLENQFDILYDDLREIEKLGENLSEPDEIRTRMDLINNVLNQLDLKYDIAALPTDFPYIKYELEDYKFFLEHDAIPDTDTDLMMHISESDIALINALMSMWPKNIVQNLE